jgi:ubiquinone/menaquinone biosynthesis C-methylase UbiE
MRKLRRGLGSVSMPIVTKAYSFMLRQTKNRRGQWGEWYFFERHIEALRAFIATGLVFDSVLEIGCGKGLYAYLLHKSRPDCEYVGCDVDRATLKRAFRSRSASYVMCDVRMLPVKDAAVDMVLCSEVLEHLDSPYELLSSVTNTSRKGVLVTFPVEHLGKRINVNHPEHVQNIQLEFVCRKLTSKKLEILKMGEITRFFLPCGILEFLRIPKNTFTMSLVRFVDTVLTRAMPLMFVPDQVIGIVAAKA